MQHVYSLNPLQDARWSELVGAHPAASIFHTESWVRALQRTYGYEPIAYTTSAPSARLTNGVLLCRVRSWLTGCRLVSVPFADHCEPLVQQPADRAALGEMLSASVQEGWQYVELRPCAIDGWDVTRSGPSASYCLHRLDLAQPLDAIFGRFHASTIQRKIRRAERENLAYQSGRSERLLKAFYRLLLMTRRRHGVPPQPIAWFRNLIDCFGDRLNIAVAVQHDRAIAAMVTIQHGRTLVYKYGGSDAAFHQTGAMPFLFWRTIERAKAEGLDVLDLGRSDLDNEGLLTFKDRLGAARSNLHYVRYSAMPRRAPRQPRSVPAALLSQLPDALLVGAGRLLYRHMG